MYGKIVFIVLFILVTSSALIHPNSVDLKPENHLTCRNESYELIIANRTFMTIDNPCILKANNIKLINCTFISSFQILKINGVNVTLDGNTFIGDYNDFAAVADTIYFIDNRFDGDFQSHKLEVNHVNKVGNIYHGGPQIHEMKAEKLNQINDLYLGVNQTHVLEADEIALINNEYFGSKQIHMINGTNLERFNNEYDGCDQYHLTDFDYLKDNYIYYIADYVLLNEKGNTGLLNREVIVGLTNDECQNLTLKGTRFQDFNNDTKYRRQEMKMNISEEHPLDHNILVY